MTQGQFNILLGLLGMLLAGFWEIISLLWEITHPKEFKKSRILAVNYALFSVAGPFFGVMSAIWFVYGLWQYFHGR